jgi:hypothetical protein
VRVERPVEGVRVAREGVREGLRGDLDGLWLRSSLRHWVVDERGERGERVVVVLCDMAGREPEIACNTRVWM